MSAFNTRSGKTTSHGMRLALCAAFLLELSPAFAADPQPLRHFVVGVENLEYLPVSTVTNGQYSGTGREILDAFARDSGIAFEYRPLAVARLLATFLDGGVDFKFPDNPNWKPELKEGRKIVYSSPILGFVDGTMTLPSRRGSGIGAIKVLGSAAGFTPWSWMEQIRAGRVELRENADLNALVRQALLGRVDAAHANVAVVNHQLEHVLGQPGGLVFDPSLPFGRDNYFVSTLSHPEIIAELDAWLAAHRPAVDEIKQRNQAEKGVAEVDAAAEPSTTRRGTP